MPDDLKKSIIEAIAASDDENFKKLLMLLLRVEDMFLDRVTELADQMTVPAKTHAADHKWIADVRETRGSIKSVAARLAYSVVEKIALIVASSFSTFLLLKLFPGG